MQRSARQGRCAAEALQTAFVLLIFLLASPGLAKAAPIFPPLRGRVVDEAGLLSAVDVSAITADLAALEAKSSDQLVVVTLKSLQGYPIEDYGYQLGRAWKIGQGGVNNGVLLIVAPNERQVRIEVGRGLEPQLTDALSQLIVQNAILPAFRRGDWADGVKAGVHDIAGVLLGDVEEVNRRLASGAKRNRGTDWDSLLPLIVWFAILAFILYAQSRRTRRLPAGSQGMRRRGGHHDDDAVVIIPGGWGGSGGWDGGSSGGGGFSGGGGDFGGGGSSGSW
jgi:uncharacterized protein